MPLLLPECHDLFDDEGSVWMCARSVTFGSFCLATLVLGVYGCRRVLPVFLNTHWYLTNLCMLALSVLQMALLVFECFVQNSAKILVVVKYCRGVQVAIACLLYGKLACEMTNRSQAVRACVSSWEVSCSSLQSNLVFNACMCCV